MKIAIKKTAKKDNEFKLEITGTKGWMMSIRHALQAYPASPIAQEVLLFLDRAAQEANIDLEK